MSQAAEHPSLSRPRARCEVYNFMLGTDCLKQLSLPTRVIRHFRGRKMVYTWVALVVSFAAVVLYCQLPLIVFPALLFIAFLASGGKNFPKVFFRTIVRDLM